MAMGLVVCGMNVSPGAPRAGVIVGALAVVLLVASELVGLLSPGLRLTEMGPTGSALASRTVRRRG